MDTILAGLRKVLNPIVNALHIRGAASNVYQYLLDNQLMMWIILAFSVLLVAAIVFIIVLTVKARKRAKAIRDIEEYPQVETPTPQEKPQEVPQEEPAVVEETQEESVKAVEEPKVEIKEEPKEEVVEKAAEKPAEKPAKKTAKKAVEKPTKEVIAAVAVTADDAEDKKQTKYRGKWVLFKLITQFENGENGEEMYFFELRASNGEKLLESQEYTSLSGAKKGIETHVSNIQSDNFKIARTKKGTYIFKLMNAKGMLLCTGENYPSRARCDSAIESTKRFTETATIDETVQEIVVKVPADEDNGTTAQVAEGAVGKWVLSKETDETGEVAYYFELFANNGEKLLSSEDYTSQSGAISGLETHKKNIEKGNFRIVPTKRGDYIFKLLNGNNQLLCLGEHYKTRRMCQNAVDSVKRFALSSPTVNDEE